MIIDRYKWDDEYDIIWIEEHHSGYNILYNKFVKRK